jgi:photosynthetic reaction center cytochrome c subunit
MKFRSKQAMLAVATITAAGLIGIGLPGRARAQVGQQGGKAYKFPANVTTSTLKDLRFDEFFLAMGVMADSLGLDCADCHPGAGSDKVDWVIDTPQKITARKMVEMVANINKTNFAGAQMVTCYTCHHARDVPSTTIALDNLYSTPNQERDDLVKTQPGQSANAIFDKYIAALGGAQKLAGLTSFIATGKSVGYEGLGGDGTFTIYAKAPDQKTTQIFFEAHPERGQSTWSYNGKTGWINVPRGLIEKYEVGGSGLEGTRLEAQMDFPGQIKTIFSGAGNWRVGPMESIGDRDFNVVQGGTARGILVTLFFDDKTNLLVRMIRYTQSPIGRVPTQTDYSDYRDVGGIKFPFEYSFLWLDGRFTAKITDVKTNVAIDAAKFEKP